MSNSRTPKPVHQRTRIGSWRTFEARFQPIERQPGILWWEREHLPANVDERRVWTIVDCDGHLYASPGWRFVNRLMYLYCTVPWSDDDTRQPDYRYD